MTIFVLFFCESVYITKDKSVIAINSDLSSVKCAVLGLRRPMWAVKFCDILIQLNTSIIK